MTMTVILTALLILLLAQTSPGYTTILHNTVKAPAHASTSAVFSTNGRNNGEGERIFPDEEPRQEMTGTMAFSSTSTAFSIGKQRKNEEELISRKNFIGVFDGHNSPQNTYNPHSVYLKEHLFSLAKDKLGDNTEIESYKTALRESLAQVDKSLEERAKGKGYIGSTACVVWCHEHHPVLVTANVGDSRAVLSRRGFALDLTRDHCPNDPDEKARIESLGGFVTWCGPTNAAGKPERGFRTGIWRVNGVLDLARSVGTTEKPHVSAEAEVNAYTLQEGDEFVIVASDGLWDGVSSQGVVSLVHKHVADGVDKDDIPMSIIDHLRRINRHVGNCGIVIGWMGT